MPGFVPIVQNVLNSKQNRSDLMSVVLVPEDMATGMSKNFYATSHSRVIL